MSAVESHTEGSPTLAVPGMLRSRKQSNATIRSADSSATASAWTRDNVSTDTLSPPTNHDARSTSSSSSTKASTGKTKALGGTWFRRSRKEGKEANRPEPRGAERAKTSPMHGRQNLRAKHRCSPARRVRRLQAQAPPCSPRATSPRSRPPPTCLSAWPTSPRLKPRSTAFAKRDRS